MCQNEQFPWFYNVFFRSKRGTMVLCGITCLLIMVSLSLIFYYAPTEKTMGIVQRIFYVHVPFAWIAFLAFFIVMVTSVQFLRTSKYYWDLIASAAAEIGTVFCTVVIMTGPLWAKPTWNVWWTWDLRLTTTLVLWLMYLGYLILRAAVEGERGAKYAAVFGIIAFIDVPVVYFSIRWWRTLHPAPVIMGSSGSGLAPEVLTTLFVCVVTFMFLFLYFLQHRVALAQMAVELEQMRQVLAMQQTVSHTYLVENEDFIIEEYNFEEYRRRRWK